MGPNAWFRLPVFQFAKISIFKQISTLLLYMSLDYKISIHAVPMQEYVQYYLSFFLKSTAEITKCWGWFSYFVFSTFHPAATATCKFKMADIAITCLRNSPGPIIK
jgi:hypothetical protein